MCIVDASDSQLIQQLYSNTRWVDREAQVLDVQISRFEFMWTVLSKIVMRLMRSVNILFPIFLLSLLSYFIHYVNSYEIGERISLSSRSSHANKQNAWRTDWVDMPPFLAPRFAEAEEIVFHGVLLLAKGNENKGNTTLSEGVGGTGDGELVIQADSVPYKINPEVDFRIGLAFDNHHHHIPWLTVFNAQQRRRLQKLEVTFLHDSYEIIDIRYQTTCKSSILSE